MDFNLYSRDGLKIFNNIYDFIRTSIPQLVRLVLYITWATLFNFVNPGDIQSLTGTIISRDWQTDAWRRRQSNDIVARYKYSITILCSILGQILLLSRVELICCIALEFWLNQFGFALCTLLRLMALFNSMSIPSRTLEVEAMDDPRNDTSLESEVHLHVFHCFLGRTWNKVLHQEDRSVQIRVKEILH